MGGADTEAPVPRKSEQHSPARAKASLEGKGSSSPAEVCTNSCCCEFRDAASASPEPGVCLGVSAKFQSGSALPSPVTGRETWQGPMEGQLELLLGASEQGNQRRISQRLDLVPGESEQSRAKGTGVVCRPDGGCSVSLTPQPLPRPWGLTEPHFPALGQPQLPSELPSPSCPTTTVATTSPRRAAGQLCPQHTQHSRDQVFPLLTREQVMPMGKQSPQTFGTAVPPDLEPH